ncbi:protein ADM2 [Rhynchocyon petersi]
MARFLALALGCISLLYLLSRGLGGHSHPARTRVAFSSGLHPQHPAPRIWKLQKGLQPQKSASRTPARTQSLQDHGHRCSDPHHAGACRPQARLLRVGCMLGTCQVHHLSHRLWRLRQASQLDLAPLDPNSPHSYG